MRQRLEADARIVVHERRSALYNRLEGRDYEWQGGKVAAVDLYLAAWIEGDDSIRHLRPGDVFTHGPFRLRVVSREMEFFGDRVLVMRDGLRALLRYRLHRAARLLDLACRRLILTAAVWSLARVDAGRVPTAGDLYAVAALKGMLRRLRKLILLRRRESGLQR
jgi:hypothetical protein